MHIVQVDIVGLQVGEAFFNVTFHCGGGGVPAQACFGLFDATLGRDKHVTIGAIGHPQSIGNDLFVFMRAVGACRIDVRDTERLCPAKKINSALPVCIRAEVAGLAGQPHGAVANPADCSAIVERECRFLVVGHLRVLSV